MFVTSRLTTLFIITPFYPCHIGIADHPTLRWLVIPPDIIILYQVVTCQHGGPGEEYNGNLPGIWTLASDTWMEKPLVRSAEESGNQGRVYEYLFNQSKLYEV